jgi:hypothetical protein
LDLREPLWHISPKVARMAHHRYRNLPKLLPSTVVRPVQKRADTMTPASRLHALAWLALAACSSSSTSSSSNDGTDAGPSPAPSPQHDAGPSPAPPNPVDEGTVLVLGLDAEDFRPTLGTDLQRLHVTTLVDGKPATDETLDLRSGGSIPHETKLKAPAGKSDATVDVLVEGFADIGTSPIQPGANDPNVVRRASTRFVPGQTRILPLRLEARCASVAPALIGGNVFLGPTCDAPTTCVAAKCVADAVDPASLPGYTSTWERDMPDACRASAPSLTVGGGATDYAPVASGATVQIVEGGQCGHHVWVGVKMAGMRQYGVVTTVSATSPGTALVGPKSAFTFAYGDAGGGACQLGGLRYQLDGATGATSWKDFLGKPLDLTVEVKDPTTGKTQTSTLHVQLDTTYQQSGGRPCG